MRAPAITRCGEVGAPHVDTIYGQHRALFYLLLPHRGQHGVDNDSCCETYAQYSLAGDSQGASRYEDDGRRKQCLHWVRQSHDRVRGYEHPSNNGQRQRGANRQAQLQRSLARPVAPVG